MTIIQNYVGTCDGGGHHTYDLVDDTTMEVIGQIVYTTDELAEKQNTITEDSTILTSISATTPKSILNIVDAVLINNVTPLEVTL